MKKYFIIASMLIIATLLISATGEIYETFQGKNSTNLMRNSTFRDNWTMFVKVNLNNDGIDDFFMYDPIIGEAEAYIFKNNKLEQVYANKSFRKTWRTIIPIDFKATGTDALMFYDPVAGAAELYNIDITKKQLVLIKKWDTGWRKNWKTFLAIDVDKDFTHELFLYDPITGEAEILKFKPDGNVTSLRKYTGFRKNWQNIMEVNLNNDGIGDLFLYDPSAGVGEFYTLNEKLDLVLVKSNPSFRKNWRHIVTGDFGSGSKNGDVFMYDPVTGEAEFYRITAKGDLQKLNQTQATFRKNWSVILSGKFSPKPSYGLFFYDSSKYVANYKTIFGVNPW
ncbi:MAG: hypothetical protein PHI68_01290 [Candidatus Cloacimonetes bacterium]|nr:hypothetical protein [Candidatus Cloacimonadota bacterium]